MCRFPLCISFAPLNHSCVPLSHRKFGYVDFSSEEDMQKAMELNGKKVMGMELKLDMPRSKETTQEDKKGKSLPPPWGKDSGNPLFLGMHELFSTQACNVRRKMKCSAMSSVPVRFQVCRFYPQSL